jgi:hypothetical protein
MGHFLLAHAGELLQPSDADVLLELEKAERDKNLKTPWYREWWAIGAAQLRPKEAETILDGAQERWPLAGNVALARWDFGGQAALPKILAWFYKSPQTEEALALEIYQGDMDEKYHSLVTAILASDNRLKISGEAMYRFTYPMHKWKADFDQQYVDWIYAQPRDPHPEMMAPPRALVLQTSGVARKLVLDRRFENADALLVYEIEQLLVGGKRLKRKEYLRMDQLVREMDYGLKPNVPEKDLRALRAYIRKEVGAEKGKGN